MTTTAHYVFNTLGMDSNPEAFFWAFEEVVTEADCEVTINQVGDFRPQRYEGSVLVSVGDRVFLTTPYPEDVEDLFYEWDALPVHRGRSWKFFTSRALLAAGTCENARIAAEAGGEIIDIDGGAVLISRTARHLCEAPRRCEATDGNMTAEAVAAILDESPEVPVEWALASLGLDSSDEAIVTAVLEKIEAR